ncbi:MAG: hypothetical protein LUK37_28945 [Clostridia bacterium]|nr:hypothetical protein [Clostridia bacterium]
MFWFVNLHKKARAYGGLNGKMPGNARAFRKSSGVHRLGNLRKKVDFCENVLKKETLCCDKATIFFENVDFYNRIGIIRKYIDKCKDKCKLWLLYNAVEHKFGDLSLPKADMLMFFYPENAAGQPDIGRRAGEGFLR